MIESVFEDSDAYSDLADGSESEPSATSLAPSVHARSLVLLEPSMPSATIPAHIPTLLDASGPTSMDRFLAATFESSDAYSEPNEGSSSDHTAPSATFTSLLHHAMGPASQRARRQRGPKVNWAMPYNAERMDAAVRAWIREGRSGSRTTSARKHCITHDVPRRTFDARLKQTDPFLQPLLGRPPLFAAEDASAIVDAVAALDHLNNGKDDEVLFAFLLHLLLLCFPAQCERPSSLCLRSAHPQYFRPTFPL
jgi:hypothetical protein